MAEQKYTLEFTRAELDALQRALVLAHGVDGTEDDMFDGDEPHLKGTVEWEEDAQHWSAIAGRCDALIGRIDQTLQSKLDDIFLSDRAPR